MTEVTGEPKFRRWAIELAKTAYARFASPSGLYWKMSVDLSHPVVASMGHHDPLDGLLTFLQLQEGSSEADQGALSVEIAALSELCAGRNWETPDPLGIGGLLVDALRAARLIDAGAVCPAALVPELLLASTRGLEAFLQQRPFDQPAESRLAFREFGLSIGLHAVQRLWIEQASPTRAASGANTRALLENLMRHAPLSADVERFWREPSRSSSPIWSAHRDINDVMLATSLEPGGYLGTAGS